MDEYLAASAAGFPDRPADPTREREPEPDNYGPPNSFIISESLITGCYVCNKQTDLSRCSACKVVAYCGPEHQAADRPVHKDFCKPIKKILFVLGKDEETLRAHPGDVDTTQNYMKSRNELIHEVKRINTKVAVQAALDHSLDLMRLGPKDNMGVRNHVPALLLRLGQDQECYDFVKWWNTNGHDYRYIRDDDRLPHEKLRNEDVFEPVDFLNHIRSHGDGTARVDNCMVPSFSDISHLVAVTLLKIRLLLDLQLLQRMKQAPIPHVPK
jgi:hypothetical protein